MRREWLVFGETLRPLSLRCANVTTYYYSGGGGGQKVDYTFPAAVAGTFRAMPTSPAAMTTENAEKQEPEEEEEEQNLIGTVVVRKTASFFEFPFVCPEPVLAKCSFYT